MAECPSGALVLLGAETSVGEVLRVVRRDMDYYRDTGGGLTLSGGEPLEQMEFALALLAEARAEGIATAVETACALPPSAFAPIVGKADLYLCDVKASRSAYRNLVGADADVVRSNIESLGRAGCRTVLRVPCVAGANFDVGLAAFVAELAALPGVEGFDLLPFHDWGRCKAAAAGVEEPDWATMRAPSGAELDGFRQACGPCPVGSVWTIRPSQLAR